MVMDNYFEGDPMSFRWFPRCGGFLVPDLMKWSMPMQAPIKEAVHMSVSCHRYAVGIVDTHTVRLDVTA